MAVEIIIPSPGESITEVTIGPWHKSDGDWVEKDETLVEIESDKVTLEVPAPESGALKITAQEGEERNVGDVIGSVDPDAEQPEASRRDASRDSEADEAKEEPARTEPQAAAPGSERSKVEKDAERNELATATAAEGRVTSLARKIAQERGVDLASVKGTGPAGRITKSDVLSVGSGTATLRVASDGAERAIGRHDAERRGTRREKMTKLRQRIAQRLVQAQHTAAMLTTFNECDMTAVMELRSRHKDAFAEKYGVSLGFMSFFCKACVNALQQYPRVNAYIVGEPPGLEIEYHGFVDISVAVGTEKGLVVPVLRNVELMSFAEVEQTIKELATKARDGKLTIDDMTGGTFTISNGGVYGSLNSTPILNPPQSGILGMHKIMKRPVEHPEKPGELALRPMMYLALSYDHRIVDGAEAVGFLVAVKQFIENPERMLLGV